MSWGSLDSPTSCCDSKKNVGSDTWSSSSYSISSSVNRRVSTYYTTNEAPPTSGMEYSGEHCPEREERDECEEEEIHLAPTEASQDCELKAASKFSWRTGPDSCCSSSCVDCCDSSLSARRSQLFQQLQELRLQYLADLWNILGKFKVLLDNHFDDTAVKFIIQEHIDVLQRMVAPMVAQKEMLASWLTVGILYQLRKQANFYSETFRDEKFRSSFDKLVIRIARRETGECLVNTKASNYVKPTNCLVKPPKPDSEQRDIYRSFIHRSFEDGETCANVHSVPRVEDEPLKRKTMVQSEEREEKQDSGDEAKPGH